MAQVTSVRARQNGSRSCSPEIAVGVGVDETSFPNLLFIADLVSSVRRRKKSDARSNVVDVRLHMTGNRILVASSLHVSSVGVAELVELSLKKTFCLFAGGVEAKPLLIAGSIDSLSGDAVVQEPLTDSLGSLFGRLESINDLVGAPMLGVVRGLWMRTREQSDQLADVCTYKCKLRLAWKTGLLGPRSSCRAVSDYMFVL